MKYLDRAPTGGDNLAIGERDPLVLVLAEKVIADGPVCSLILAPVRVHLAGNVGRKAVGQTLRRSH
jgi:hypothetical protein